MPFTFTQTELEGVVLIEPKVFGDERGFFKETYKESDFIEAGIEERFVQDNHSLSSKGVLRGLHFQLPPKAQGKLVRVTEGAVWDVAVDIRVDSPTFGSWVGFELSGENHRMLYVPPGFAHGFVTLSDRVHFLYKCTAEYDGESERGIRWNDGEIDVEWPVSDPSLSERDVALPYLREIMDELREYSV